jgi:uncharacterized protein (DUF2252 family)
MDILRAIAQFNHGRDPERLSLKYQAMRSDPFVFLRGACHLFYQRLPSSGIFKTAPLVWSCGDLHLENFGSYKGDDRLAYFDLNDFDEAALAPASWDVVRMLTSLRVGAKSLGLKPGQAQTLCEAFLRSYGTALASGKALWVEPQTAHGRVKDLFDKVRDRQRVDLLDDRTELKGKRRALKLDGKRALPASAAQRDKVMAFMQTFTPTQPHPAFYKVLDVARRIAGTGSLGVERYVILVQGKGSPHGNYLLDLKAARPSALAPYLKFKQPTWASHAHRIVEVQRRMQAVSMAFLQPVVVEHQPFVLRGLQPSEDRVSINGTKQSLPEIEKVITTMASVVAWAQLRSGGRQGSAITDELIVFAQGKKWQRKLLEASHAFAVQTQQDAATFAAAFDDGVFNV